MPGGRCADCALFISLSLPAFAAILARVNATSKSVVRKPESGMLQPIKGIVECAHTLFYPSIVFPLRP
jgi:hypothetical protein